MNQPTRNRYLPALILRDLPALMLRDRAIALSLLIGCFTASLAPVLPSHAASAEPLPVQPTPQVLPQPTAKPASVTPVPVARQLLGQWLTKEPLDGDMVMLVFAPDGKVFIISGTAASGNAIASQFQYRVDDKPQPLHLDIVLAADATVETLFEFTANGELRLQMLGTRPGKVRPVSLSDNATRFQKISDDTTLPPGIELKKTSAPIK